MGKKLAVLALLVVLCSVTGQAAGSLAVGFYDHTCPNAKKIVRGVVEVAMQQNLECSSTTASSWYLATYAHVSSGRVLQCRRSLDLYKACGFEAIDAAKEKLEEACPGTVSCADIVAFAARDASAVLSNGRVSFPMPGGRRDGRVSLSSAALQFLPPPSFNLSELTASFAAKGLDVDYLVVLSGAHSVGRAHCSAFTDRLAPGSNSTMNDALAASLRRHCPASPNATNDPTVNQDVVTPTSLDNQYYKNLLNGNVLASRSTNASVTQLALSSGLFEAKFAKAMVKMATIEVKTAPKGEITRFCRKVNGSPDIRVAARSKQQLHNSA
ncbi:hypothetical protein EJB05_10974, partial [Eragrostis curvula]